MVYRSQFVIVHILLGRWYDYGKGGVAAGAVGGLAGVAAVAGGGVAAGEEPESPRFAGVRRRDEMTPSSALRSRRPPWGMIWFFVDTF